MSAREELAAAVAELGALPMPTGDTGPALTEAALEAKVYNALVSFNSVACWDILRLAQMRQYLAEHVAADLFPEVDRLRARVAELEAQADCSSQMTVSDGTSQCALPVRHGGDHRNAAKNHYWSDEYADAARVRSDAPSPPDLRPGADAARRVIRDRQATEDPHDSPRHHTYALGRDLPEVDTYRSSPLPAGDALCATCGHNGAAHHHAGTACWADLPKRLGESIRLCKCSAFAEVTR